MWLLFQPERNQKKPSPSPYFWGSLSRECFIRLIHVDDALVAAHELRDSNRNRDMVEKNPELFSLYRLRQFLGVKQVIHLLCRLHQCVFLGGCHTGPLLFHRTRLSRGLGSEYRRRPAFAYADGF